MKGRRNRFFLATKVHPGPDAGEITTGLGQSLARLQTDHVDLFHVDHPCPGMRPEDVMRALDSAVRQGKARFVGACNFPAWLFAHCNAIAERNGWARWSPTRCPTA